MPRIARLLCIPLILSFATIANADERAFLQSLAGEWSGRGTVVMRIGKPAINVNCRLRSTAGDASVSMKATCRGLLVVNRTISADLTARGNRYGGIYVGPAGGRSALTGRRKGNAIDLAVRWSKTVNGDRSAEMIIEKVGANGLRLRTIDRDPSTGRTVTTSDIALRRS